MSIFDERQALIDKLVRQRDESKADCRRILDRAKANGRSDLEAREDTLFKRALSDTKRLTARIANEKDELQRLGFGNAEYERLRGGVAGSGYGAAAHAANWARQTVDSLRRSMGGEQRAVVSGSIDVPSLVEANVTPLARPQRLIDLFSNRLSVDGNAYEFFQATTRTNTATAVADYALKPTSTNTVRAVQDRCRVVAHLSEPAPLRLWYDIPAFTNWLTTEMVEGVLDGLEQQIINGNGAGENMLGLLSLNTGSYPVTTQVAYTTDLPTTLRSAQTALQTIGVMPTGWALNPVDAQAIDLLRWSTGGGFLSGGYQHDDRPGVSGSSDNIFGPNLPRVVSPTIPQGVGILGDWSKLRLYVRQGAHVDVDASGTLFQHNEFQMRGEGRYGIGHLQPQHFAIIDLTP